MSTELLVFANMMALSLNYIQSHWIYEESDFIKLNIIFEIIPKN